MIPMDITSLLVRSIRPSRWGLFTTGSSFDCRGAFGLNIIVREFSSGFSLSRARAYERRPGHSHGWAFPFLSVLFSSDDEDVSLSLSKHRPERAGMVCR